MKSGTGPQQSTTSCLLFRVGPRLCALPVSVVVETMRPLPVEPFAQAPLGVQGIAIIRGAPLPVLVLASLFNQQSAGEKSFDANIGDAQIYEEKPTRFITVKVAGRQIALAVSAVVGVESIASALLQQLPLLLGVANADSVQAIGAIDRQLLLLLNATRLVDDITQVVASAESASW